jgi:hypothetical protein
MLQRLVAEHGAERVWNAGIETLGYPATWQDLLSEVMELQQALETAAV